MSAKPGPGATPPIPAARAKLMKPLDAHTLADSPFYLNTVNAWQTGNCKVRANTMIEGQVVSWSRRKEGAKQEELGIRFEPVACYGSETLQVTPILVAVHGPRQEMDDAGLREAEMKQAMMSMEANRGMRTMGGGPGGGSASGTSAGRAMSGAESQQLSGVNRIHEPESGFKTGEVRDLRGVKMTLPAAGSDMTALISSHSIALESGTQFYIAFVSSSGLVRPSNEHASAPADTDTPNPTAARAEAAGKNQAHPPLEEPVSKDEAASTANQRKICAAGCAELDNTPAIASGPAAWSLSLATMGLRPRMGQVRVDLDDDASVHFLGNDQVLVTFNYHSLTRRSVDAGARPRQIRVVLLSSTDGHILQTQEWPVYDDRQYTWDLGDGRLLAHIGHELVILGRNLAIEGRYKLMGPVLFAEVAPGKSAAEGLIAVATVHERHTPEAHQKLATFLGPDWPIEEDYDLTMLDGRLQPLGTKSLDAKPAPIALLQSGMVSAQRAHGQSWKIEQLGWDGRRANLASLPSACSLGVASLPASLLFATTCAADQASSFYWILNPHGSVLLSGHTPGTELVQQAASSANGGVVAIATTGSYEPIDLKVGARVSDFHSLDVLAYRVSDGKKVLAVRAAQGSALRQTFALAPSGDNIAVLAGSTLQVYTVHSSDNAALISAQSTHGP